MSVRPVGERRPSGKLGDVIANATVRSYFYELIGILTDLHEKVEVQHGPVDIRAEYAGRCICRIVPYRELVHLRIGEAPVWEVRVRDEAAYLDAVDRILDVYLSFIAADAQPTKKYAASSFLSR
jgi:hypothetical protein